MENRIIITLFFFSLLSLSVFGLEDLTPEQGGTISPQANSQLTLIQAKLVELETKIVSMQSNSMTSTDFETFRDEIITIIKSFENSLLAKIIIASIIVQIFFKAIELYLKIKGVI